MPRVNDYSNRGSMRDSANMMPQYAAMFWRARATRLHTREPPSVSTILRSFAAASAALRHVRYAAALLRSPPPDAAIAATLDDVTLSDTDTPYDDYAAVIALMLLHLP